MKIVLMTHASIKVVSKNSNAAFNEKDGGRYYWKINKCKSQYLSHQLMYYESNMKSEGTGTIIYRNTWISERTGLKGIGILYV